ncbi:MAG: hypothetical protein LUD02_00145 [Tannerellaceae bacterium]|nr:hypothetical protein [Tannerellaceae bacterium]
MGIPVCRKINETLVLFPTAAAYLWTNTSSLTNAGEFLIYAGTPGFAGSSTEPRKEGSTIRCIKDTHAWDPSNP